MPQPQRAGGDGRRHQGLPLTDEAAPGDEPVDDDVEELFEHAPCGFVSTRPDGTIVRVNDTLLGWTGHRREDLVGVRQLRELLSVGGQIYWETHYAPLVEMQGEARAIAVEMVRADGRRLPALLSSVLVRDADGRPTFMRTAVFDATDRRSYERELLEARREAEASEARATLLAQTLQQSLLPPALPKIPGLDIAAAYRPAGDGNEVGGDFYDVFERAEGDWALVLGDVRGKGAGAAVVTALARYTVRAAATRTPTPSGVLETLNEVLLGEQTDRFCTVVLGRLRGGSDGAPWRLTIAAGGHPLPLRLSPGAAPTPVGRTGTLIGVFDAIEVTDHETELAPGEAVVLYTDGVTEAHGAEGFYGEDRLTALLADATGEDAATIVSRLVDDVVAFQQGMPRDDIAIVVAKAC